MARSQSARFTVKALLRREVFYAHKGEDELSELAGQYIYGEFRSYGAVPPEIERLLNALNEYGVMLDVTHHDDGTLTCQVVKPAPEP